MMNLPHIYVKRISLDSYGLQNAGLSVDLDFCIKFSKNSDPLAQKGFIKDKKISNGFKILVVQITSSNFEKRLATLIKEDRAEELFSKLIKDATSPSMQTQRNKKDQNDYRFFDVRNARITLDGAGNFEVPFYSDDSFKINSATISSLTYLFLPYWEQDLTDYVAFGTPTVESVFSNGQLVKTATAFSLPSGQLYTGPVHKHGANYMVGPHHTSTRHDVLTVQQVRNTTIQDERIFNLLKRSRFDFSYNPATKGSHFSDMLLSRDSDGDCRFLFHLDFKAMVREASALPWLYRHKSATSEIFNLAKLNSLKVHRRHARPTAGVNDFNMIVPGQADTSAIPELIASSKDVAPGNFENRSYVAKSFRFASTKEDGGSCTKDSEASNAEPILQQIGNIREIKLPSSPAGIRSFAGADVSMKFITYGIYQYSVEATVEDPSIKYLKLKYNELQGAYTTLKKYYNSSTQRGLSGMPHYNSVARKFTNEFSSHTSIGVPLMAVQKYIEVTNLLRRTPLGNSNEVLASLINLIGPVNGRPENIEKMLSLFLPVMNILEKSTNIGYCSAPGKSYKYLGAAPTMLKNSSKGVSRKYHKWFDSYFNSDLPKNTGYHFIAPSSAIKDGPAMVNWKDYNLSIDHQMAKYFSTPEDFKLGQFDIRLGTTKHQYLSPIRAALGGTEVYDFLKSDEGFYNIDKYNSILSEILRFNYGKYISGDRPLFNLNDNFTKFGQKLRNQLVDFFADQGCTVDNIDAFTAVPNVFSLKSEVRLESVSAARKSQFVAAVKSEDSIVDKNPGASLDKIKDIVTNRLKEHIQYESDTVNPNNVLVRLASDFINFKIPSPKNYNIFDTRNDLAPDSLSQGTIDTMPNQIKSLLTLYSLDNNGLGSKTGINSSLLVGNHRDQFGFLYMNFLNLMEVEVLSGFENNSLKAPTFRKLNIQNLRKGTMLCRMSRYNSDFRNIPHIKVDFPVYNEYFLLEYAGSEFQTGPISRAARSAESTRYTGLVGEAARTALANPNLDLDMIGAMKDAMAIHTGTRFIKAGGTGSRRRRHRTRRPGAPTQPQTRTATVSPAPMTTSTTINAPAPTGGSGGGGGGSRGGY